MPLRACSTSFRYVHGSRDQNKHRQTLNTQCELSIVGLLPSVSIHNTVILVYSDPEKDIHAKVIDSASLTGELNTYYATSGLTVFGLREFLKNYTAKRRQWFETGSQENRHSYPHQEALTFLRYLFQLLLPMPPLTISQAKIHMLGWGDCYGYRKIQLDVSTGDVSTGQRGGRIKRLNQPIQRRSHQASRCR